jgi:type IV pilus assembly protein PilM
MATAKTVWGIDIGQCALKALKLRNADGELQVEAFDIIEHPKILSQPDADRKELIRNSLEQFLARNSVAGSLVAASVPGQTSFTRFVKLPPVETKRVPDIVRFEAEQQIPFPINDVIWRWQAFKDADSPDVEVGIFAMKKVDIEEMLSHFSEIEFGVDIVQMSPLALYNFMTYDEQRSPDGATLLADVGADKTDLVVADGAKIWTRTVQIGGNNFTEALVKAFKLSFSKAEKHKRTAATSKYARQIFQAMRPVFADLVQEIQRSIGYYTSLHRETRFKKLIGLGNGFRLPGLQKFLEQNLNLPVVRIDSYNKLTPSPTVNAPTFTENVLSFAVAYGLALQGLGETAVTTNLLPTEVARKRVWAGKRPAFVGAAAAALATVAVLLGRNFSDRSVLRAGELPGSELEAARSVVEKGDGLSRAQTEIKGGDAKENADIQNRIRYFGYREYWPAVQDMITHAIASAADNQRLLGDYDLADSDAQRAKIALDIKKIQPRSARRMLFIDRQNVTYLPDVSAAAAEGGTAPPGPGSYPPAGASVTHGSKLARGFKITIGGTTPLSYVDMVNLLNKVLANLVPPGGEKPLFKVQDQKQIEVKGAGGTGEPGAPSSPRGVVPPPAVTPSGTPAESAPTNPDPLFPKDRGEDRAKDNPFEITFTVTIEGDGIVFNDVSK